MAENRKQRNQGKSANNSNKGNNYGGNKRGGYTNTKGYGGSGKNFNRNGQR